MHEGGSCEGAFFGSEFWLNMCPGLKLPINSVTPATTRNWALSLGFGYDLRGPDPILEAAGLRP